MSSNSRNRTACFKCGTTEKALVDHHTSYFPEKKKPCCNSCHRKIHAKRSKISKEEMQVSIKASIQKTAKRLAPIDFNINEVRGQINNLLIFK